MSELENAAATSVITARCYAQNPLDTFLGESCQLVLVVAVVERWIRDRKVAGSTPGWGAIKSTRST